MNYKNAPYFFKWTSLPYCSKTIKKKITLMAQLSIFMSIFGAIICEKKNPDLFKNAATSFKFYGKLYLATFLITSGLVFIESLLF